MSEQKWVRSSLRHLSHRLGVLGKSACATTMSRLLRKHKYSLKVNVKKEAGADHADRNRQFEYIAAQKKAFLEAGLPVVSVDTKKKELVGNFKNSGQEWC